MKSTLSRLRRSAPKYAAEFVGTFFLVFTVGANIHTHSIGTAVSIGAMLTVMVYSLGPLSGAHFNPAVTTAIWLSGRRKLSDLDFAVYVICQAVSGILGSAAYWLLLGKTLPMQLGPNVSAHSAIAVEVLYTSALCYVVLNVMTTNNKIQGNGTNSFFGLAIGFTVTAAAVATGPLSGVCLNPAISLGSVAVQFLADGSLSVMPYLYFFASIVGSALGALGFFLVQGGLTGRFEYDPDLQQNRPLVPMQEDRNLDVTPPSSRMLVLGEALTLPLEVNKHELFCGLTWRMNERPGSIDIVDIDLTCVKFSQDGECLGAVYFAKREDFTNGIRHSGDEAIGNEKKNADLEYITLKLANVRSNVFALVFVVMIYTSGRSFDDVEMYRARLVDIDDGKKEFCRLESNKLAVGRNALISCMLYRRGKRWAFKAVDSFHTVPAHSSYRKLVPEIQEAVEQVSDQCYSP
mmetsp:Transcript_30150/g.65866  ORF Transcript_30150/g.65866 Transcript_30150/m.65866 type:complete len:462 (+) Transcript_30150:94-1479(+)